MNIYFHLSKINNFNNILNMTSGETKFSFYDKDNMILIVVSNAVFTFDGEKWNSYPISDINLPGTDFSILKRPSIAEIYQPKNSQYSKVLLISGGFNMPNKSSSKQNFVLNFFHDEKETKCILDFKYSDMTTGRFLHSAVNIANKYIILIGGKNEKEYLSSCECLSIDTKKWSQFPSMLSPRANFASCVTNNSTIYLYGGYIANGQFNTNKLTSSNVDLSDISKSKWTELSLKSDKENSMPKACCCILPYEDNIILTGGTNGQNLLSGLFEIKISEMNEKEVEVDYLGEAKTARNNTHFLMKDGYFYLVGGAIKKYEFNESKTVIENYSEKFTFDLNNDIESSLLGVDSSDIIEPLNNFGINSNEYKNEPGFPYNCSIITKQF